MRYSLAEYGQERGVVERLEKFSSSSLLKTRERLASKGYASITKHGYLHIPMKGHASVPGEDPTPLVHRIASLIKRWLLGTHHGRVEKTHLDAYLNEFVFRFNRRRSASRGKLFFRLVQGMVRVKQV